MYFFKIEIALENYLRTPSRSIIWQSQERRKKEGEKRFRIAGNDTNFLQTQTLIVRPTSYNYTVYGS